MNSYFALVLVALVAVVVCDDPRNIQLLDLKPEEVQQLLAKQNTDLHFAPKIDTVQIARTSPEDPDLVEDIYEASQFHGQDGLGRYLYGYAVPDIAKVEGRNGAGNVRGSYNWIERNGNVIKVQYWDDGTGFHQTDNIPKVVLKPVQETEEVRLAREAHEKAWKEAAAANKVSPDQYRLVYNDNPAPQPNYAVQETQDSSVSVRRPEDDEDQYQGDNGQWVPSPEDVTSEPRGFFYSFLYPAGVRYNKAEYDTLRLAPHDDEVASLGGNLE